MSGFDTGSGSYDKIAQRQGGEGLDIDAQIAGAYSIVRRLIQSKC